MDRAANQARPGILGNLYRNLVMRQLQGLRDGHLSLTDSQGTFEFGDRQSDLCVQVVVHHCDFYRAVALGGGLGVAESLIEGHWQCDDLTALVRIFVRNLSVADQMDRGLAVFKRLVARLSHGWRRNSINTAKQNIHEHYDLGNDFYSLWLDESMNYSSGIFPSPASSMQEASLAKMDRACRKLQLSPGDHLVEIGTGWGAMAIHAATHYGCRVTTTTISDEQFRFAKNRVAAAGLDDRITVLCQDYRALSGSYDKLVSIEMLEAVGHEFYPTFFQKCSSLLRDSGTALIQSIVILDDHYQEHLRSVDFIRRYIFPGGCLPSISTIVQTAAEAGQLRTLHLEDIAPHYAETLRRWRKSFGDQLDQVRSMKFDDKFIRMWEYYLCYCEAVFEERQVNNVQILLAKRGCRVDPLALEL